jgi:hypothetical protein
LQTLYGDALFQYDYSSEEPTCIEPRLEVAALFNSIG